MSALILRNRFQGSTTLVDNEFIDRYMPAANGEYVKVYLLLLRHLNITWKIPKATYFVH